MELEIRQVTKEEIVRVHELEAEGKWWFCILNVNEPQQNGMCAQRRLKSAWTSAQYDQSSQSAQRNFGYLATHWVHSEYWSGWSESSLGARAILLNSSCGGSNTISVNF